MRALSSLLLLALLPIVPSAAADPLAHDDCGASDASTWVVGDTILIVDVWFRECVGAAVHREEIVCRPPGLHVDKGPVHVFVMVPEGCAIGALVERP